uniref:HELICc2 domain-containing protein n=1 Tax=Panagrellus redivivus TaxID=6233 RepID=A0A7E4UQH3_PANRE
MFSTSHPGKQAEKEVHYYIPLDTATRSCYRQWVRQVLASNTLFVAPDEFIQARLAALVAYNYYRIYPTASTVVICQEAEQAIYLSQFEAVGLPSTDVHVLSDDKKLRANGLTKGVFFVTAKVMTNLLGKNTISHIDMKLLVLTDALKAVNNSGISKVVKLGLEVGQIFRVLAICNTLPKAVAKAQCMISNLAMHTLLLKNANDSEISPILHCKNMKVEYVSFAKEREAALLRFALAPRLAELRAANLINCIDPDALIYSDIAGWKAIAKRNAEFSTQVELVAILLEGYRNFLLYGIRALFLVFQARFSEFPLLMHSIDTDDHLHELNEGFKKVNFEPYPGKTKTDVLGSHPKFVEIYKILRKGNPSTKAVAFCDTPFGARALAEYLGAAGISVVENHSDYYKEMTHSTKYHGPKQHRPDAAKTEFLRSQARCLVSTKYIDNFGMMQFDLSIAADYLTAGYRFSRFGKNSFAVLNREVEDIPPSQRQFDKRTDIFKTNYNGYRFRLEESKLILRRRLSSFPVEYSPKASSIPATVAVIDDAEDDTEPDPRFSAEMLAILRSSCEATRKLIQQGPLYSVPRVTFTDFVKCHSTTFPPTPLHNALVAAITGPVPTIRRSSPSRQKQQQPDANEPTSPEANDIREYFQVRSEPVPRLKEKNDPAIRRKKRIHWLRILKSALIHSEDMPKLDEGLLREMGRLTETDTDFRERSASVLSDGSF